MGPTLTGARADLPPIRFMRSLAMPIAALMLLSILTTLASTLVISHQLRLLRADFDLLTGVYVPVQERLAAAAVQSARIAAQIQVMSSTVEAAPPRREGDALLISDALAERARLVERLREPLDQALTHMDRINGELHRPRLEQLARRVEELSAAVDPERYPDPLAALLDTRRQRDINRMFRELVDLASLTILEQRERVAAEGRRAERLAVWVAIASAILAGLAAVAVALILRPLRRLSLGVRRLARGDWAQRIALTSAAPKADDEVSRLAREFNLMAEALAERERALIRGERLAAIGKLAAQITHEIRNPLASLALNAELLDDELDGQSHEARRLLDRIAREVERLGSITESYLALGRRPAPVERAVDLGSELADLAAFVGGELARAGVELRLALDPGLPAIAADRDQFRQVILNLLGNAKDALAELPAGRARAIELRASGGSGGCVTIEVRDSGPGVQLAEPELDRIFEPFVSAKASGTGLGLSIVQQIAHDHGATIALAHTGPQGTCFVLRWPVAGRPGPPASGARADADGGPGA